ncbi:hypothetical protein P5750_08690 [Bacillus cereus]|uniref:hypothetical protein n=1 Tax=Bacillus cereus TaxID=1396 RepID=UPI002405599F|nr:hypothetical protein [Bacillus cereus]MDF9540337.1 hypothetical protein [Bacillus cereus]MDF9583460.1 hypothetical protein [Bacillus cereus]MDF9583528.1 hypothetical protein [Bacillus cereus]MDG1590347.1 hypothetical protein [Bacillus cereus]
MFNATTLNNNSKQDSFNFGDFLPQLKNSVKTTLKQSLNNIIFQSTPSTSTLSTWEENDPSQLTMKLINNIFVINNYKDITEFLNANDFLLGLILRARMVIYTQFTEKPKLELRLEDTDETPNAKKLYIIIHSNLDLEDAYQHLQKVDENWWINASSIAKGKMNIDLEY